MADVSPSRSASAPLRALAALAALYVFLVAIGALSAAFKSLGSGFTDDLLGTDAGPLVSLFAGILATTLVQSSSTTTSVVVGLVAAGSVPLESAVFMIMGANIGTTVTNTLVSLGHMTRSVEYRRAFAAATVHDFFNVLVLLVAFPLEVLFGPLTKLAGYCTQAFQGAGGGKLANPIKAATKPVINVLKDACESIAGEGGPVLLAILAILLTFAALYALVKSLRSLMETRMENLFDRVLFKNPVRSLFFGLVLTILVQSSSITTSVAVPLVGAGIVSIRQVLPYTMGANVGTTMTAMLAALGALAAVDGGDTSQAMFGVHLAFFHVLFNVFGVALMWNFRSVPIGMALTFAKLAMRNRAFPIAYIVLVFYVLPLVVITSSR